MNFFLQTFTFSLLISPWLKTSKFQKISKRTNHQTSTLLFQMDAKPQNLFQVGFPKLLTVQVHLRNRKGQIGHFTREDCGLRSSSWFLGKKLIHFSEMLKMLTMVVTRSWKEDVPCKPIKIFFFSVSSYIWNSQSDRFIIVVARVSS